MPIGVISKDVLRDSATMKQAVLLFDSLALWPLGEEVPAYAAFQADLEYLYEQQVLRDTNLILPFDILGPTGESALRAGSRSGAINVHFSPFNAIEEQTGFSKAGTDGVVRVAALAMRASGLDAVPVASGANERTVAFNSGTHRAIELVLPHMPVPAPDTPWEDILNFRRDPVAKERLHRLENWDRRIMAGESTRAQVEADLREDLHSYEEHMRLHSMKINHGVLKTIVKTTAQVLEATARLKFTEIADALFMFSERRLALLEAELTAPGRHLAYVVNARERFAGAPRRTHPVPENIPEGRAETEKPMARRSVQQRQSGPAHLDDFMRMLGIRPAEVQAAITNPDKEQVMRLDHDPDVAFHLYLRASKWAVPARHVLVVTRSEAGEVKDTKSVFVPDRVLPPDATPLEAYRQLAEHFGVRFRFGRQNLGRFIAAGLFPVTVGRDGLVGLAERLPGGTHVVGSGYFRERPSVAGEPAMMEMVLFAMLNISTLAAELGIQLRE
jgi:hypothetical protein